MKTLIAYAMQFIGVPYKWGGSTHDGIDCSGLVHELMLSIGMVPPEGDRTAQSLYEFFSKGLAQPTNNPTAGALVFYGQSLKAISHVAFMIDQTRMIEAGGGGHLTITRADAERDLAFVRIRPYTRRKDLLVMLMPNYPTWMGPSGS